MNTGETGLIDNILWGAMTTNRGEGAGLKLERGMGNGCGIIRRAGKADSGVK